MAKPERTLTAAEIPAPSLPAVAAKVLGRDIASATAEYVQRIGTKAVGSGTVGIYKVSGEAKDVSGESSNWSAVLKIVSEPEDDAITRIANDSHVRELEAYRSGQFEPFRGDFRSARCHVIEERSPEIWMWLEDLSASERPPWPDDLYVRVARDVGAFNGYWATQPTPGWQWLAHTGVGNKYRSSHHRALLAELPDMRGHEFVARAIRPDVAARVSALWAQGDVVMSILDSVPVSLCHGDCHARNLYPVTEPDGRNVTVAGDWASVGISHLGTDAGIILASAVKALEMPPEVCHRLAGPVFEAYVNGLRSSGWTGNQDQVQLAYLMALGVGEATRICNIVYQCAMKPAVSALSEDLLGMPTEDACDRWAEAFPVLLEFADEAEQLARRMAA